MLFRDPVDVALKLLLVVREDLDFDALDFVAILNYVNKLDDWTILKADRLLRG